MKISPLLALCFLVVGCTDKENQAKLAAIEAQTKGAASAELVKEIEAKLTRIEEQNQALRAQIDKITGTQAEIFSALAKEKKSSRIETVETLQRVERYRMFNTPSGAENLSWAFLYDTQTGRVWRYYRNQSNNGKGLNDEGFGLLVEPTNPAKKADPTADWEPMRSGFDPSTAKLVSEQALPPGWKDAEPESGPSMAHLPTPKDKANPFDQFDQKTPTPWQPPEVMETTPTKKSP